MRWFTLSLLLTTAIHADELTVLPADGPAPRKMLANYLLAECQKKFDARKAVVDGLKTPADVAKRQAELRQAFINALGGFPEKTPLNAKVVGTLPRQGYRIEKVVYESRPNHHISASLYIPEGKGPFPAILMPIGHSITGKSAEYVQLGSILLAKNGFVVLAYDPIGQGERSQLLNKLGAPALSGSTTEHTMVGVGALLVGRCTASYRIWDGIRSLDYLCSREEVDAKRLGCTGCSGGGTLTSYLMALDDRIQAAAPSCYLTTLERLFNTLGPQDAEQNITGQVAFGMDHADYIAMRAPKPTLICAATRDFFDIQGTWTTFREAKRLYGVFGQPEKIELIESDTAHGYPQAHREAVVRFFARWLQGKVADIQEAPTTTSKDAELRCTRTGQVLDDLKGTSVFDLNAERESELSKSRKDVAISKILGLPSAIAAAKVTHGETIKRTNYVIRKRTYTTEAGIVVPALLFENDANGPLVVYLHDQGKVTDAGVGGPIEALVHAGKRVLAIDVRGAGETAPGVAPKGKPGYFGVDFKESFLALHLNRPLLGQRLFDLLSVLATEKADCDLVAFGTLAPVALHAAVIDQRIKKLTCVNMVVSWSNVVRTPVSVNQLTNAVPNVLAYYDLPALAAKLAPGTLTLQTMLDAAGQPVAATEIKRLYPTATVAELKQ